MPALDLHGASNAPKLEGIPEEPSEDGSRATSRIESDLDERPASPYSEYSYMDGKKVFNFSRPRPFSLPPAQEELWRTPVMTQSPQIGSRNLPNPHVGSALIQNKGEGRRTPSRHASYDEDEEDDAAPPPVIRTFIDREKPHDAKSAAPQAWIYRPYADSVMSDTDTDNTSILSTDTVTTDDTESIAESTTTDASEFAFDGRLGWNPQRPSQAERERQRWAGPVVQMNGIVHERNQKEPTYSARDHGQRESWYSDSSNGTATTRGSGGPTDTVPRPGPPTKRPSHKDIFEAAGERLGSIHARPATHTGDLSRQNSANGHSATKKVRPTTSNSNRSSGVFMSGAANADAITPIESNGHNRPSDASTRSTSTASIDSAEWKSSSFDISSLSEKQLAKLEKKGINPALYLEMKQAKVGAGKRRGIGLLSGNSFLG